MSSLSGYSDFQAYPHWFGPLLVNETRQLTNNVAQVWGPFDTGNYRSVLCLLSGVGAFEYNVAADYAEGVSVLSSITDGFVGAGRTIAFTAPALGDEVTLTVTQTGGNLNFTVLMALCNLDAPACLPRGALDVLLGETNLGVAVGATITREVLPYFGPAWLNVKVNGSNFEITGTRQDELGNVLDQWLYYFNLANTQPVNQEIWLPPGRNIITAKNTGGSVNGFTWAIYAKH